MAYTVLKGMLNPNKLINVVATKTTADITLVQELQENMQYSMKNKCSLFKNGMTL